jgi:hypothetical protein
MLHSMRLHKGYKELNISMYDMRAVQKVTSAYFRQLMEEQG